jgi:CubicO group peptidase (beta-lactamase class C family)
MGLHQATVEPDVGGERHHALPSGSGPRLDGSRIGHGDRGIAGSGIMRTMVAEPPASPGPPAGHLDPWRVERAFDVVAQAVGSGEPPAAVLAVAGADGPVLARAFGSDASGGRVGVAHRFRVASVTKPIVATAVMQLVEEGRVTLPDPIRRVVPEFAPPPVAEGRPGAEAVTLWHLLTHTSGAIDLDWVSQGQAPPSAEALIASACMRPLVFVPGTAYAYASDTFYLLGLVLQRVGGHPTIGAALRARIFEPLGMTATGFEMEIDGHPNAPVSLVGSDDVDVGRFSRWISAVEHPGGGLWATAHDLVAFGRASMGSPAVPRILGDAFLELMRREQTAGIFEAGDPPRRATYGLGWGKSTLDGRMPGPSSVVDHAGATGSRLWVDPTNRLVVALLAGRWGTDRTLADAAIAAVYGALQG